MVMNHVSIISYGWMMSTEAYVVSLFKRL